MSDFVDLLAELSERKVRLCRTASGKVASRTHLLTPGQENILLKHALKIEWALVGGRSGHAWAWCGDCREAQLIKHKGKKCVMTPQCKGKLDSIARIFSNRV